MDDKTLVTEYLKRKKLLDGDVESARGRSEDLALAADLGEVGIDLAANSFGDAMQRRAGWNQSSAGAPIARPEYKSDLSSIKSMGQRDLQAAQERRNQGIQDFDAEQKLTDLQFKRTSDQAAESHKANMRTPELETAQANAKVAGAKAGLAESELGTQSALDDPNSAATATLRRLAKGISGNPEVDQMTGTQILKINPMLADKLQIDAAKAKADSKQGHGNFKDEQSLRKEIETRPTIVAYREIKGSANKISDLLKNPNPQTGQAAIIMLNKLLDPGSVVKEGEFARTAQGQSLASQIQGYIEKLKSGDPITPEMRNGMILTARVIEQKQRDAKNQMLKGYEKTITDYNFDPQRVLLDLVDEPAQATQGASALKPTSGITKGQDLP